MEHRIEDGDVVRLAELLDWYKQGVLRQSRSATRIWVTIQFTKPQAKVITKAGKQAIAHK